MIHPSEPIKAELDELKRVGARCLVLGEPGYPPDLAEIYDPPPVIAVHGNANLLKEPQIAIARSRNASASGRRFAETLARDLGEAGFVVTSGLARGIDTAAHRGAIETGTAASMLFTRPTTKACIGTWPHVAHW